MNSQPGRIVVDLPNPLSKYNQSVEEIKHLKEFSDLRHYLISAIRGHFKAKNALACLKGASQQRFSILSIYFYFIMKGECKCLKFTRIF